MPVTVLPVRTFKSGTELGVGLDRGSWFVYMKGKDETEWQKHCGPYSTREQAEWWIREVRET